MLISLEGIWQARLSDGTAGEMKLPGTLDESGLGHGEAGAIATRFTRKYTYEGEARLTRKVSLSLPEGKRVFLEAERARVLRLLIDGEEIPVWKPASISTPYIFEVTGLTSGEHEVVFLSDNSYPGLPHDDIVYASAATDETQTNWNGILGYLRLRTEEKVFLSSLSVYPVGGKLRVRAGISSEAPWEGELSLESEALEQRITAQVKVQGGGREEEILIDDLPLAQGARLWDEEEGYLYEMKAKLKQGAYEAEKTVSFGIRSFGDNGQGRLALNGRVIFLRGEANCGEFPETGYPPMETERWLEILKRYREYGVNCVRFHSHCPPEAAFEAADRLGMLMQPELSHWNPKNAFESEESFRYYRTELEAVIRTLANHPSFVMLTFGNELHAGKLGHERMDQLLELAHKLDGTRLFANGSNVHYGWAGCDPGSDFYTSTGCRDAEIRGTFAGMAGYINREYPGAKRNYDRSMEIIRQEFKKPVFSFEVGQFEVLPDFTEFSLFHGISDPENLRMIQAKAQKLGLEKEWGRYVEATGELSRIGYREEVEAAMRTRELSGISLLGLQDFPGQGTALVGMMNSHLEPKPYAFAKPERFRAFFRESLPLLLLDKYTYEAGETLRADVLVANFGKTDIAGELRFRLREEKDAESAAGRENTAREGILGEIFCPKGGHTQAGTVEIAFDFVERPTHFFLTIQAGEIENTYPVWVYPQEKPVCPDSVYETEEFDEETLAVLRRGGKVYLTPKSDQTHLPHSIQAQFTTDFWSVGTFPGQEGGMGQLIDESHPAFAGFPTQAHTDWQWWAMASRRAVILPRPMECIITEMDSYAYMRPMAQLLEFRCGGGMVLFSSMELQGLQQYPEARALLASLYAYLDSDAFAPRQEMTAEEAASLCG